jgi:hypothetical protein
MLYLLGIWLIQIGLRKLLYICIGVMLLAFGVISLTMGDFTLGMLPVTILMFVGGLYLARREIVGNIRDASGESVSVSEIGSANEDTFALTVASS